MLKTETAILKRTLILSLGLTAVGGCASQPHDTGPLTGPCHAAKADSNARIQVVPPEKLPPSNIFKLRYMYPGDLKDRHLQGRALVRLKVDATGKIDSAEFLRAEAAPRVESAMCNLIQQLQYDVSNPEFSSIDSRTFIIGIRYCLGNCSAVLAYPGFEKKEISITASEP